MLEENIDEPYPEEVMQRLFYRYVEPLSKAPKLEPSQWEQLIKKSELAGTHPKLQLRLKEYIISKKKDRVYFPEAITAQEKFVEEKRKELVVEPEEGEVEIERIEEVRPKPKLIPIKRPRRVVVIEEPEVEPSLIVSRRTGLFRPIPQRPAPVEITKVLVPKRLVSIKLKNLDRVQKSGLFLKKSVLNKISRLEKPIKLDVSIWTHQPIIIVGKRRYSETSFRKRKF